MAPIQLCQICLDCLCRQKGIQHSDDTPGQYLFLHHRDLRSVEDSAKAKCPICKALWSQLHPIRMQVAERLSNDEPLTYLLLQPSESLRIEGAFELAALPNSHFTTFDGIEHATVTIFLLQDPEVVEQYYSQTSVATSTGSNECWDVVLKWLETCSSEHVECSVADEPSWYPTRLIDIGSDVEDLARLTVTAYHPPEGHYMTLSHRWGKGNIFKLTEATVEELQSGIETSSLPLTFQHAVEIARRLKKRYIWIDSLCIFQDEADRSDWLKEAALMDKVYSNSFLNIAATGAADGSEGLFVDRDPAAELRPVRITCPTTVTEDGPGPSKTFILNDALFLERDLMHAPLNSRAWVLQERLLSPRVLHFGCGQIFWECRNGVLCERFPNSLPSFMSKLTSITFKSFNIGRVRPGGGKLAVYHLWSKIVRAYSVTQLTYPGDKTVAISGIAKYMQGVFQDEYVAGLWRGCLEAQLLWNVNDMRQANFQKSTRGSEYRAPTWSWLSVDGEISPGRCLRTGTQIEVLDISLSYISPDTTGLIGSGSLALRGRLRPLELRIMTFTLEGVSTKVPGVWLMTIGGKVLQSDQPGLEPWQRGITLVHLDVPCSEIDLELWGMNKELFVMSAGGPWDVSDDPFSSGDVDSWHDMLLFRCVDKQAGTFHRFGLARLDTNDSPYLWSLVQEYDANEAELPCVEYDAISHSHTIVVE